jgi:peroxiredoxin
MRAKKATALVMAGVLLAQLVAFPAARANTVGKPASDFTLKTHDGKSLTLSRLKGKRGAVLVFFATWCPACMAEVPQVKKFVAASRGKKVLVYGVNFRQPQRIVLKFVRDKAVNYRILLDSDGKVAKTYGVRGIPTIIGIDADGVVRYRAHALPKDHDAFIKLLTKPVARTVRKLVASQRGRSAVSVGRVIRDSDGRAP